MSVGSTGTGTCRSRLSSSRSDRFEQKVIHLRVLLRLPGIGAPQVRAVVAHADRMRPREAFVLEHALDVGCELRLAWCVRHDRDEMRVRVLEARVPLEHLEPL